LNFQSALRALGFGFFQHPQLFVADFVDWLDRQLAVKARWLAACAAILALQIILILKHEPWLDEYQSIQLAVQAPDISTLLDWLRYEGHPPLWYFVLRALSYVVDPLSALKLAALACALLLQGSILIASPFTRAERLLLASSEFLLFECLTVSRSTTLGALLLVLAFVFWSRRGFWIVLALLPMCDFLFGVLSCALVAIKWRDRTLWWPGVTLWVASGIVAGWTVLPAPDVVPALQGERSLLEVVRWGLSLSDLAVPLQGLGWPKWNDPPNYLIAIWGWLAFLALAWKMTEREPLYRGLLFGFTALTLVFSVGVYRLSPRHLMLIALFLILLVWRSRRDGALPQPAFRFWLVIVSICGFVTAVINLWEPFDTAALAAAKIDNLGLRQKHWMTFPDSRGSGVSAISGLRFERDGLHCMQSFVRWNYRSKITSMNGLYSYLKKEVYLHGKFYLLTSEDLENPPSDILISIADIPAGYDGYAYHLYVVGPNSVERPISLPLCVPGQRPFTRLPG
jgi:hypothetical protein